MSADVFLPDILWIRELEVLSNNGADGTDEPFSVKTRIQAGTDVKRPEESKGSADPVVERQIAPKHLTENKQARMRDLLRQIWRDQGLTGFYRGYCASMLNTFSMQFAYFYWYTFIRSAYCNKLYPTAVATAVTLNTAAELILGALAGALAQVFTIPVSVVATRQQLSPTARSQSLYETTAEILRADGPTGLWRGLKASLVLTVNPAITYGSFERLKPFVLGQGGKMTPAKAFMLGAISKTIATVVTFPYILAKVRLQAKYDDVADPPVLIEGPQGSLQQEREQYANALDVFRQILAKRGFAGLYQGMQAHIFKAVLAQALLFGIKDLLQDTTIKFLLYAALVLRRPGLGLKTG